MLRRNVDTRLLFLHIPKCGGTTVRHAIAKQYRERDVSRLNAAASTKAAKVFVPSANPVSGYGEVLKYRNELLPYFMAQNKFVSGHIAFSEEVRRLCSERKTYLVTLLRRPEDRLRSVYFYSRYKNTGHAQIETSIQEFIDSKRGRSQGMKYVEFLSGVDLYEGKGVEQAMKQAKANLEVFDIVGFLEDLPAFKKQLERMIGKKLTFNHRRESPVSNEFKQRVWDEVDSGWINEICKPDSELYEYAYEKFS